MTRILLAAIFAGVLAGLCVTALQQVKTVPLILAAEEFEGGGHDHGAATATEAPAARGEEHSHGQGAAAHDHGEEAWAPADGLERTVYTLLANLLTGTAFSLLLAGLIVLTGSQMSLAQGLVWGAAGFATFTLAPSFGLPPELPGMPAADLLPRQTWWVATVVLTGAGLGLLLLQRRAALMALGVVLIALPHVIGAPQPADHHSGVPAGLAADFAAASIATAAVFWLVLGGALGALLARRSNPAPARA